MSLLLYWVTYFQMFSHDGYRNFRTYFTKIFFGKCRFSHESKSIFWFSNSQSLFSNWLRVVCGDVRFLRMVRKLCTIYTIEMICFGKIALLFFLFISSSLSRSSFTTTNHNVNNRRRWHELPDATLRGLRRKLCVTIVSRRIPWTLEVRRHHAAFWPVTAPENPGGGSQRVLDGSQGWSTGICGFLR